LIDHAPHFITSYPAYTMKNVLSLPVLLVLTLSFNCLIAQTPTVWLPRGIGGGGALFFPKINPDNDNEFYISCDMGEMFHSADYGLSYSQIPFQQLTAANVATYEFTNNPNIAYNMHNDGNNSYPVKTTNGGAAWTTLPGYNASLGSLYKQIANYYNPNQVLLNYYGDIVFSNNGGATFSLVKHAADMGVGIIMGGAFFDGNNIYIGTNEGIFYSNNGGASFTQMTNNGIPATQRLWHFSGAKSGATIRFLCITGATADVYNGLMPWDYYGFGAGVYTMDNASGTWISASSGINFASEYLLYTGMAWNNINTMYLAGNDASLNAPLIYKSTNGGATWSKIFLTTNNQNIQTGWQGWQGDKNWSWGETAFGIAVAPFNADKVLFGDFGFVHTTADGGLTWKQAYVNPTNQHPAGSPTPKNQTYHSIGLENTTCWQVHWINQNTLMGAFSDIGGIRSADAGATWGYTYSGFSVNSLYRVVQTTGGTIFGGTSNIHDIYQSTYLQDSRLDVADANGKIVYSTNNGANWTTMKSFGHPVFWLALDPNNQNRLYASVIHYGGGGTGSQGGIWVTENANLLAASTWTKLPNPPRTEGHPACIVVLNDGSVVCTFSGRRNASGAFTASSGVFVYQPSSGTWTDVSHTGMYYWTKDIVIDPNDPAQNTWYAGVFSGWGGPPNGLGGLYRTTNRGANWVKLTGSQFDRVTSITFNPQNTQQAYLTTERQGLWVSNNITATTPTWSLVDNYPFQQPERVFFNPYASNEIWVTNFGNGMKVGSLCTFTPTITGAANACNGNSYNYTVPVGPAGATYTWLVSGGSITAGQGTHSINVLWSGSSAGTVSIIQTE